MPSTTTKTRRRVRTAKRRPPERPTEWTFKSLVVVGAVFWLLACQAYAPSFQGPFIFDDVGHPFASPAYAKTSLAGWVSGSRPLLMFSYWLNYQVSGTDPGSYHSLNVFLHVLNSLLVLAITRRILTRFPVQDAAATLLAAGAAGIFLLHPLQTEAVAYVSGRSDVLCAFFVLASLLVFLRQDSYPVPWLATGFLLVLYALACLSKEQAAVLPLVFLLTDMLVYRRGLRESLRVRARLYLTFAVAAAAAGIQIVIVLANAKTAGFNTGGISWYEYFFSELRVLFLYLRIFIIPFQQNADYDVPISRTPMEHHSIWALAGLLVLLWIAWRFRRRYRLAVYGFLLFLLLLAPTSSFVPILDLAAERRMYLPIIGLLLCSSQLLMLLPRKQIVACLAIVLLVLGMATYRRSAIWAEPVAFWREIVSKSPGKARGYLFLITEYVNRHQCGEALAVADRAPAEMKQRPEFLIDSGAALECAHRSELAIVNYRRAAEIAPSAANYLVLAHAYRRFGYLRDAEGALQAALLRGISTPYEQDLLDHYQTQTRARTVH